MMSRSKQFVDWATRWRSNDFRRARVLLTATYILILFAVVASLSIFLQLRVTDEFQGALEGGATITKEEAEQIAVQNYSGAVTTVEAEARFGTLVYAVEFLEADGSETDAFINAYNGEFIGVFKEGEDAPESWGEIFLNDFGESLLLGSGALLFIFSVFGYYFAGVTLRPIEEKVQQHEKFSADVAHELRTPLSAIYASAEEALRIREEANYQSTLERIKKEAKRLIALTESLLKTNTRSSEFSPVRLDAVIEGAIKNLTALAAKQDVAIEKSLSRLSVAGSAGELEELVFNLIHNAIKFSRSGGVVEVSLSETGRFSVRDHGMGMDKKDLDRIFDRFYTASVSRTENDEYGFGLGLSIVKRIADNHSARIKVSSQPGRGTEFVIEFFSVSSV